MFKGKKVLSVTPARGGSKGVIKKNLRKVGDLTLTGRVAKLVSGLEFLDYCLLSSDDPDMQAEARRYGLGAPFSRPQTLSGDRVAAIDVWAHAWQQAEELTGQTFDIGIYIEPTCPLRRREHIEATLSKLVEEDWTAVWTLNEIDPRHHPFKKMRLDEEGHAFPYDDRGREIIARQQLETLYERNGVCYAATRQTVLEKHSLEGDRLGGLILDEPFVSIDSELDVDLAEFFLQRAIKLGLMQE
ncbi:acylneuraminate cytidylyltransferase family protein [uncultured Thalassospira sp.]|uniref:acylneuraminate cytidylyltransferase family protein n=1 Tax=uncultured Thalassospira sp. TaxID=404382 RepID=UPI002584C2A5|nr:acylneuraminate cytidylyltransferase family protein [uncultured Thalassospira sp.]